MRWVPAAEAYLIISYGFANMMIKREDSTPEVGVSLEILTNCLFGLKTSVSVLRSGTGQEEEQAWRDILSKWFMNFPAWVGATSRRIWMWKTIKSGTRFPRWFCFSDGDSIAQKLHSYLMEVPFLKHLKSTSLWAFRKIPKSPKYLHR